MLQQTKKNKYPALEPEFVIPDLSQLGNVSALTGSGRPAPTDTTSGSADNVVQFPPLEAPQAQPVNNPMPAIAPDEPVNMGYGRTMESQPSYPPLAAETPFQAQAPVPQASVKQLSPLEQAQGDYEKAVAEPAHKQGKAAQIANFALQFIQDAFTPGEHQYEWLGNRKKQMRVDNAARTLAPLQAQETYKQKIALGNERIKDIGEDNRRQREQFATKEKNRFLLDKDRFQNRLKALEKQAELEGGKRKRYSDESGKQWWQFNDGRPMEPIMNPENPSEQDVDPIFKTYQVFSPITNTQVAVRGKDLYSNESNVAVGNANRDQQTNQFNATKQVEVLKENINNDIQWQKDNTSQLNDAIAAEGLGGDAEIAGWRREAEEKARQYEQISRGKDFDGEDKVKALNTINDEILELNTKVLKAMENTETGKTKAAALRQNMRKRPARLVYTPIQAVKVGGQMPNVSEDVFRERLIANGVKDPAQQRALIAKAKSDGVIK